MSVPTVSKATRALFLVLCLAVLFAQAGGHALEGDALPYSTGYLLTGNYTVGSVDFVSANSNLATGTIPMSGVPANADILAAFLYWETIAPSWADPRLIADYAWFRETPIKAVRVKTKSAPLVGKTGQCFTSGEPLTMT